MNDDEFHERADAFLDQVVGKIEEVAEGREDVDVEMAVRLIPFLFPTSPLPLPITYSLPIAEPYHNLPIR